MASNTSYVTDLAGWLALPELQLPELSSQGQQGTTYLVKKVGFLAVEIGDLPEALQGAPAVGNKRLLPTIMVRFDQDDALCRLPLGLAPWAQFCVHAAHSGGNPFPAEVEFGILEGRAYAEIA